MLFLIPTVLLNAATIAPLWAANQAIAPLRMRATAYAIIHLGISAASGGLAPLIVGYLNDVLAADFGDQAIRYSLFLIVFTNIWGIFHAYMAAVRLPEDLTSP